MFSALLHIKMFLFMQQRDAVTVPQAISLFVQMTTPRSSGTLRTVTYSAK
jgi:hypothetical protein